MKDTAPVCPGCHVNAEPGTWPPSVGDAAGGVWWCWACLKRPVVAGADAGRPPAGTS